mgnify:CR=1 FL=1
MRLYVTNFNHILPFAHLVVNLILKYTFVFKIKLRNCYFEISPTAHNVPKQPDTHSSAYVAMLPFGCDLMM